MFRCHCERVACDRVASRRGRPSRVLFGRTVQKALSSHRALRSLATHGPRERTTPVSTAAPHTRAPHLPGDTEPEKLHLSMVAPEAVNDPAQALEAHDEPQPDQEQGAGGRAVRSPSGLLADLGTSSTHVESPKNSTDFSNKRLEASPGHQVWANEVYQRRVAKHDEHIITY